MTAQHDESDRTPGRRGVRGLDDKGGLEAASVAELLAELAQVEDAIRSAAQAGHPLTAGLARREDALVEALRRRGAVRGDA
jgi:hypothetical protein